MGLHPFLPFPNLVHPPLAHEIPQRLHGVSLSEQFNHMPQLGILLPNDLLKPRGVHACLLKLLEWYSGLDGLVLADPADEQNAVITAEALEELVGHPG